MRPEILHEILVSGVWGTCGPWEDKTASLLGMLAAPLMEAVPGSVYALLTYSHAASKEILSVSERMEKQDVKDGISYMKVPLPAGYSVKGSFYRTMIGGVAVILADFSFAGAILTTDQALYERFYQIHHCGHRPGIGATVDLSEEVILGGDMRISEWQAASLYELLSE